jgi:hypothetical protein
MGTGSVAELDDDRARVVVVANTDKVRRAVLTAQLTGHAALIRDPVETDVLLTVAVRSTRRTDRPRRRGIGVDAVGPNDIVHHPDVAADLIRVAVATRATGATTVEAGTSTVGLSAKIGSRTVGDRASIPLGGIGIARIAHRRAVQGDTGIGPGATVRNRAGIGCIRIESTTAVRKAAVDRRSIGGKTCIGALTRIQTTGIWGASRVSKRSSV